MHQLQCPYSGSRVQVDHEIGLLLFVLTNYNDSSNIYKRKRKEKEKKNNFEKINAPSNFC